MRQTFRHVLERALHPRSESYAAVMMSDIVGAAALTWPGARSASTGVTAPATHSTIRLAAPSRTLAARLANPLFCAVPPTTPTSPSPACEAIPTAGPYYIASYVPGRRLLLRRNPHYRGDRPARLREIDFDLDVGAARAEAAVRRAARITR